MVNCVFEFKVRHSAPEWGKGGSGGTSLSIALGLGFQKVFPTQHL